MHLTCRLVTRWAPNHLLKHDTISYTKIVVIACTHTSPLSDFAFPWLFELHAHLLSLVIMTHLFYSTTISLIMAQTHVFTVPEVTADGAGCLLFEQQMWGHLAQGCICIWAAHWKLLPNQCQSVINKCFMWGSLYMLMSPRQSPSSYPFLQWWKKTSNSLLFIFFGNINCLCLTWIRFTTVHF